MKEEDIYRRAIAVFGVDSQTDVLIEEMSELTKAIIKFRRYGTAEELLQICEEKEDVRIMLEQLDIIINMPGHSKHVREAKLKRLDDRIKTEIVNREA